MIFIYLLSFSDALLRDLIGSSSLTIFLTRNFLDFFIPVISISDNYCSRKAFRLASLSSELY